MKRGCLISVLVVVVAFVGIVLFDWLMPSTEMRSLPKTATDKQEYFSGFNDYVRLIKATLPPEDYEQYAKNLGMTKEFDSADPNRNYANLGHGDAPEWWDPPKADETTYFEYEPEWARFLKYKGGVVYFMDCSW